MRNLFLVDFIDVLSLMWLNTVELIYFPTLFTVRGNGPPRHGVKTPYPQGDLSGSLQDMNTLQKQFLRAGDVTTKSQADDAETFAIESQRPKFAKKKFCASQSFSRNIKSWEGPSKSFPLGVPPPTD